MLSGVPLLQVDNLSKDILARLIPEGVKGAPQ